MRHTGRNKLRCVPAEVIRDILQREYPTSTVCDIANELCTDERVVGRIMNPEVAGAPTWIGVDKADAILTKLDLQHLWHTEPGLIAVNEYLDTFIEETNAREDRERRKLESKENNTCINGHPKDQFWALPASKLWERKSGYCRECSRISQRAYVARQAA